MPSLKALLKTGELATKTNNCHQSLLNLSRKACVAATDVWILKRIAGSSPARVVFLLPAFDPVAVALGVGATLLNQHMQVRILPRSLFFPTSLRSTL